MRSYKVELNFTRLSKALAALEQMAAKPHQQDRGNIDATIQRFEFTIELFGKLLRAILEDKGVAVQYPKETLQEAYRGGLIDDETSWLLMLKDRNLTSHTYDEKLADQIFLHIQSYVPLMRKTFDRLSASL